MTGKNEVDYVKWFSEIKKENIDVAGGKGANLGEMYGSDFPIPPGFVVTAQAYREFVEETGLDKKISEVLDGIDVEDTGKLTKASEEIRKEIESAEFSEEMKEVILEAYEILDTNPNAGNAKGSAADILKHAHEPPFVAIRSSATAEDLADASFAGQQESFLNVKGDRDVIMKVKKCFSSLFTPRAIYYRTKKGFDHNKADLAVVVQKMIDSDKSGVVFSRNPVGTKESILLEAVFGLGEGIVSGRIKPDSYTVSANLEEFEILKEEIGYKKSAIVRDSSGNNKIVSLTEEKGKQRVLDNYQIKRISQYSKQLEEHYGKPQDIEFAIQGSEIYIVQSRPITTKEQEKDDGEVSGEILLSGLGASPGVSSGKVKIVHDLKDLDKVEKGDVLVTEMTNPDMVVSMQKAAGIVTDEGGITSHAAIVSREMGIPAVVGTGEATTKLEEGQIVSVDGTHGKVILGATENKLAEVKPIVPTKRTKIKVIVDIPDYAERAAKSGAEYVGLTRLEGIIATSGKHPVSFVKNNDMASYTTLLSNGLKKIVEHFKEIWIRSSDIRSDEYRNLEGAPKEVEGNPMLGNHGIRFSLKNEDILKAELEAVKDVADSIEDEGKKIGFMAPQIISLEELKGLKRIAKEVGMPSNVKIGIMVETPAAVQIINDLCEEGIDFVSFGTNDLTQYILALDRNNEEVQNMFNEMNPAVLSAIGYVIRRCKKYGVETSICGQAGSREDMAAWLVEQGIDSISVNADSAKKISEIVAKLEGEIGTAENAGQENQGPLEHEMPGSEVIEETRAPVPVTNKPEESKDMEDAVLEALEGESISEVVKEKEEYNPGVEREEDLGGPSLNEAIPVESEHLEEQIEEKEEEKVKEIEITKEMKAEEIIQESASFDEEGQKEKKEEQYTENEEVLDIF